MPKLALLLSLIAATTMAQGPAARLVTQKKQQAARKKPPAFMASKAKWRIRGRIRPQFMRRLLDRSLHWREPGILIFVNGAERRWSFPPPCGVTTVRVLKDRRVTPSTVCVMAGQQIDLNLHGSGIFLEIRRDTKHGSITGSIHIFAVSSKHRFKLEEKEIAYVRDSAVIPLHTRIHVLPHPLFTTVKADGTFVLPWLPDGEYEIVAIHEKLGTTKTKVTVEGKHPKPITNFFVNKKRLPAPKQTKTKGK